MPRLLALIICLVVVVLHHQIASAEVSASSETPRPGLLVLSDGGGSSDTDPIPAVWTKVRFHVAPVLQVNVAGEQSGDGAPCIAMNPNLGTPSLVWSRYDGQDREIYQSSWLGDRWSDPLPLTSDPGDDLDPQQVIDPLGLLHVAWWRAGAVLYMNCHGEDCSVETELDCPTADCRRPTLALSELHHPVFAFEAHSGVTVEVVALVDGGHAEVIAETSYFGPAMDGDIDVQVHQRGDLLWIDWVQADHLMAYSAYDPDRGTWSAPSVLPYSWNEGTSEAVAREMARVDIRLMLLRP